MKLLTCIIKYLFTEIKCTETMIAFAQGQVVFQLEPEKKTISWLFDTMV